MLPLENIICMLKRLLKMFSYFVKMYSFVREIKRVNLVKVDRVHLLHKIYSERPRYFLKTLDTVCPD